MENLIQKTSNINKRKYLIHQSYIFESLIINMTSLRCQDYGYECDYVSEGEIDNIVDDYREHMNQIHGIDYSRESILLFIKRKKS